MVREQAIPWPQFSQWVQSLSWSARLAFSVICLERIAAAASPYISPEVADVLRGVQNAAWQHLAEKTVTEESLSAFHEQLDKFMDQAKGSGWIEGTSAREPILDVACSAATFPVAMMRWPDRHHQVESVEALYLHLIDLIAEEKDQPLDKDAYDAERQWSYDVIHWLGRGYTTPEADRGR
jgi:hypothetical protein